MNETGKFKRGVGRIPGSKPYKSLAFGRQPKTVLFVKQHIINYQFEIATRSELTVAAKHAQGTASRVEYPQLTSL